MLKLITEELKTIKGAKEFYSYLEKFVYKIELGDEYDGYGGFIRENENIMFNFDLRSFAPKNRDFFWEATQKTFTKLKVENNNNEGIISLLNILIDMHKRIKKGEDPIELNHMSVIEPEPNEKLGPGW